jgi:hypothetical protein
MTVENVTRSVRGTASEVRQWLISQGFSEIKNLAAKTLRGVYTTTSGDKTVTVSRIEKSRSIQYVVVLEYPAPASVSEVELPELLSNLLAVATSECLVGPKGNVSVPLLFSSEYFEALSELLMDKGSPTQAYLAWSWLEDACHTQKFDGFPSELVEYLRDVLKGWIICAAISPRFGVMLRQDFILQFINLIKRGFALEKVLSEKAPMTTVLFYSSKLDSIGTIFGIKTTYCAPMESEGVGYIHLQTKSTGYGCYMPTHIKGVVFNG